MQMYLDVTLVCGAIFSLDHCTTLIASLAAEEPLDAHIDFTLPNSMGTTTYVDLTGEDISKTGSGKTTFLAWSPHTLTYFLSAEGPSGAVWDSGDIELMTFDEIVGHIRSLRGLRPITPISSPLVATGVLTPTPDPASSTQHFFFNAF